MIRNVRGVGLFVIGILIGLLLPIIISNNRLQNGNCGVAKGKRFNPNSPAKEKFKRKKLIFVGVMTAEKFLDTRAKAVYDTWAKDLPGTLMFFSSSSSKRKDLPVVSLEGVDDSYPPQRKSMMMLKYMYDNYGDEYEWFLRSDDDVYIRAEKLAGFLRTFNSSEDLYLGQAGTGARNEKGMLGLGWGDNFCMGGPSAVLSASTLRKVTPYLEHCLKHLVSIHEDVEVGRCIKHFVGISCTWAFEMQSLFYHNQSRERAFTQNLNTKSVRNAITLHPLKRAEYMYRLHSHYKQIKIQDLNFQCVKYQRRLKILDQVSTKGVSNLNEVELVALNDIKDFHQKLKKKEAPIWEMFTPRKIYSYVTNSPEIGMLSPTKDGMNLVLGQTMSIINQEARKVLHRTLEFKRLNHGYRRYHPMYGMQYMLDLLMKYHRHIGRNRRRMTVHVRHHAYLQQPFGNLVYSMDDVALDTTVHFILPLTGRLGPFRTFMANYEEVCLKRNQKTSLIILYFIEVSPSEEHMRIFKYYKDKYPKSALDWIDMQGQFSRSLALTLGSAQYEKSSLLFFCDVDLQFTSGFIDRCRANTILSRQVYYPIVFSQFTPNISPKNLTQKDDKYFSKDAGFWRQYAFGITCQFRTDFDRIGGFDTTIQGWGMEDVDLYDRFVLSDKHTIHRAQDPGLVHIYHDVKCDKNLPEKQLVMCYSSKANTFASQRKLYELLVEKSYLHE